MSTTKLEPLRGPPAPDTLVDRTYPLEEAAAAIRHMLDGKARGKLVVSVSPSGMQTPHPGSTP
jgi:hypothetical protein